MKASDLEKHIDNIIIDGLIKEAEQDNADFEVAMKNMSDEDFLALIYDSVPEQQPVEEPLAVNADSGLSFKHGHVFAQFNSEPEYEDMVVAEAAGEPDRGSKGAVEEISQPRSYRKKGGPFSKRKVWVPWVAAAASAAAILLIVLIPAFNSMNSRVCESALLASMEFSRGGDIAVMPSEEVKKMLPELEDQYSAAKKNKYENKGVEIPDGDVGDYYLQHLDPDQAGLDLVQAYLRLNNKEKAAEVLKEMTESSADEEFKQYCKKLLEILE